MSNNFLIPKSFVLNHPSRKTTSTATSKILANSKSFDFHKSLKGYNCSPLVSLKSLSNDLNIKNLFVKDESERFGLNAFKVLGASYAINHILNNESNISVFCTATDGNHGRALAWSANNQNKKCVVYVPENTTDLRIDAIINEGAEVYKLQMNYEKTCDYAKEMSQKHGWTLVQDTSWDNYEEIPSLIMSGYLTHFIEIENQLQSIYNSEIDIIFLQCGVGSWAASCIWYFLNNYTGKTPKIVLVEPVESAGVFESFKLGSRSSPKGSYSTIMAGLNCGIPSKNAWEIIKNGCDAVILISDTDAIDAIRKYYYPKGNDFRVVSGESGAAGLAGLVRCTSDPDLNKLREHINLNTKSNILLFNTEGATDINDFNQIINV